MSQVDTRLLGYLGRGLSYELSAVSQYLASASLAEVWGDNESAKRFREEVVEELKHAERLTNAMAALGALPGSSQLTPVQGGRNVGEVLAASAHREHELIMLYQEAARYCARIGDEHHAALFRDLLADEQAHAKEIEAWFAKQAGNAL